jgi:hypothetical protein
VLCYSLEHGELAPRLLNVLLRTGGRTQSPTVVFLRTHSSIRLLPQDSGHTRCYKPAPSHYSIDAVHCQSAASGSVALPSCHSLPRHLAASDRPILHGHRGYLLLLFPHSRQLLLPSCLPTGHPGPRTGTPRPSHTWQWPGGLCTSVP